MCLCRCVGNWLLAGCRHLCVRACSVLHLGVQCRRYEAIWTAHGRAGRDGPDAIVRVTYTGAYAFGGVGT